MGGQHQDTPLKRGLKNRHIQLIALGGAIGTGLFLGIAQTIKMAGPAVLLGYAIGGFIAFLIMRQLGEMVVSSLLLSKDTRILLIHTHRSSEKVGGGSQVHRHTLCLSTQMCIEQILCQYISSHLWKHSCFSMSKPQKTAMIS